MTANVTTNVSNVTILELPTEINYSQTSIHSNLPTNLDLKKEKRNNQALPHTWET